MIFTAVFFLIVLLFFPSAALAGSRYGLSLWLTELVPVLLPFFIAIRLFQFCVPQLANRRPFLLCGLLCGYPGGAAITVSQYKNGLLARSKAYFYLGFANNPSPMFTMAFCGQSILSLSVIQSACLLALNIGASFLGSFLCSLFMRRFPKDNTYPPEPISITSHAGQKSSFSSRVLDDIILNSFETLIKIGGYVMIFSILGQLFHSFFHQSAAAAAGSGILEISSGASYLKNAPLSLYAKKVLMSGILAFGGLSAAFQTNSILADSELSLFPYLLIKAVNSLCAVLLSLFLFRIF